MFAFVIAISPTQLPDYPDYVHIHALNYNAPANIGCLSPAFAGNADVAKDICDGSASCHSFSVTQSAFRSFGADASLDTYLKIPAPGCSNISGGCSSTPADYWSCVNGDGTYAVAAQCMHIPPLL